MNEYHLLFFIFFFGTWALSFLPQIKLYFPEGLPLSPRWAIGVAFLCFCGLRCSKEEFQNSTHYTKVARHEYCHQIQQRLLSPLGFAIIYFTEMLVRRSFFNSTWKSAYENLYFEKQAMEYMEIGKLLWNLKGDD